MTIGGMTRVGKGAVVEAACVGAHVEIGEGAVVVGGSLVGFGSFQ